MLACKGIFATLSIVTYRILCNKILYATIITHVEFFFNGISDFS